MKLHFSHKAQYLKPTLLSKKIQRAMSLVLVFALMFSNTGSILGYGSLDPRATLVNREAALDTLGGNTGGDIVSVNEAPTDTTTPPAEGGGADTTTPPAEGGGTGTPTTPPAEGGGTGTPPIAPPAPTTPTTSPAPTTPVGPGGTPTTPIAPPAPTAPPTTPAPTTPTTPVGPGSTPTTPIAPPPAPVGPGGGVIGGVPTPTLPIGVIPPPNALGLSALLKPRAKLAAVYVSENGDDATGDGTSANPYATLAKAYAATAANGTINVSGTVAVNAADIIGGINKKITIQGNGNDDILKRAADCTNKDMISIVTGGDVTLSNIIIDGGATYKGGVVSPANVEGVFSTQPGSNLVNVVGGTLTVGAGAVLRNNAIKTAAAVSSSPNHFGSAIWVDGNGTVDITDGEISGNLLSGFAADGAALSMHDSENTLTMSGGKITNNYAERMGSAMRLSDGTFEMSGGEISGNLGSDDAMGAVCVHKKDGAGAGTGAIKLSGTPIIKDNNLNSTVAHNIFIYDNNSKLEVTGNLTSGADVWVTMGGDRMYDGATIGTAASGATGGEFIHRDIIGSFQADTTAEIAGTSLKWKAVIYAGGAGAADTPEAGRGSFAKPYATLAAAYADTRLANGGRILIKGDMLNQRLNVMDARMITIESCDEKGAAYEGTLAPDDARLKSLKRSSTLTVLQVNNAGAVVNLRNIKVTDVSGDLVNAPVISYHGTLNLQAGAVVTGTRNKFGAVYLRGTDAFATMEKGASITNNTNYAKFAKTGDEYAGIGGGVTVLGGATFTMNGGVISGNSTNSNEVSYGGGIGVYDANLNINGDSSIIGNSSALGGGVYVCVTNGTNGRTISINNNSGITEITGNTATQNGGGVFYDDRYKTTSTFKLHDQAKDQLRIIGNTVGGKANNLYLTKDTVLDEAKINQPSIVGVTTEEKLAKVSAAGVLYEGHNIAALAFRSDDPRYMMDDNTTDPYPVSLILRTEVYVGSQGSDTTGDGTLASPYKTLKKAYDVVADNGHIKVIGGVTMEQADNIIVTGKTITIQSAGGTLTGVLARAINADGSARNKGELITVNAGGTVTLDNIILDGGATYNGSRTGDAPAMKDVTTVTGYTTDGYRGQLVYVNKDGTLNLNGGTVLGRNAKITNGGNPNDRGSAMWVEGVVCINNAIIRDNYMRGYASDGAAFSIYTASGNVSMTGGKITNNSADRMGSAIRLSNGTFSMGGGEISGNYAPAGAAWGAICANSGTLNLGGTAVVKDNFTGTVQQNIYLGGSTVKMTRALATGADLHITSARPYTGLQVVTNAIDTADYSQYFKYDGNAYAIRPNTGKHLVLATAGELYVSSTGKDTNPGTLAEPYRTLKKAYSVAGVGAGVTTTIMVMDNLTDTEDFVMDQNKTVVLTSCTAKGEPATEAKDIHTVTAGGSGNHFTLRGNAKVVVKNLIIADGGANRTGRLFIANDGGAPELTLETGATLKDGKSQYGGGAIYWRSGKLNVNSGAAITGCKSASGGGAIWIDGGEVTLDGAITGNNADKDGGGVCYNGGTLTLGANAQITDNKIGATASNLYIKTGKVVNVTETHAADKKIGITTETAPVAGGAGVLVANGTAAAASITSFVSDVDNTKMAFEVSGDTVLLRRKNSNAFLSGLGWKLPNETASRGANDWQPRPNFTMVDITVPFEPVAGELSLIATLADSKAKIIEAPGITITNPAAGASVTGKVTLPITDENKTQYFKVRAEDGTEQTCTVNLTRSAQVPKVATFNFDSVKGSRTAADATVAFRGLTNNGATSQYTFKDETGSTQIIGLGVSTVDANGVVTLRAETTYCDAIDNDTSGNGWKKQLIGDTGIEVASHTRKVNMYKNNVLVGTFTAQANNASATDLAIVIGINGKLPTYADAYQYIVDLPAGTDSTHPQKNDASKDALSTVETNAKAKEYINEYVKTAVLDYYDTLPASGDEKNAMDATPKKYATAVNEKDFVAPVAGTAAYPDGYDGVFTFTVTAACGNAKPTTPPTDPPQGAAMETVEQTIVIKAHKYGGVTTDKITEEVAKLSITPDTVFVNYGTNQGGINEAIAVQMKSALDTAVSALKTALTGVTAITVKDDKWTITYNGTADGRGGTAVAGNYTANAVLEVAKSTEVTTASVSIPLEMTVKVRPDVDAAILTALEAKLPNTFADMEQVNANTEAKVKKAVEDKFTTKVGSVDVTTSHADETPATRTFTFNDSTDTKYTVTVNSQSYLAPEAQMATGVSNAGQYRFTVDITLTRKDSNGVSNTVTRTLPILDSDATVPQGIASDNGIYIIPTPFNGVTDVTAVDIVKALLEARDPDSRSHELNYDLRNDAATRLNAVQAWVDETIAKAKGKITVTSGGTNYYYDVRDGKATKTNLAGTAREGDPVTLTGTATASLKATELNIFTDLSTKASVAAKKDTYSVSIIKSTSPVKSRMRSMLRSMRAFGDTELDLTGATGGVSATIYDVEHSFTHKPGQAKITITKPADSKGPFTTVLLNKGTGALTFVPASNDLTINIPSDVADGDYMVGVRDSQNRNSAYITNFTLPAASATNAVTLSEGSMIVGNVSNVGASGARVTAPTMSGTAAITYGTQNGYMLQNAKHSVRSNIIATDIASGNKTGVTSTAVPAVTKAVNIALQDGVTVIGGAVQVSAGEGIAAVPAPNTKVTITSPNGARYIGYTDAVGSFAVAGVTPTSGTGFTFSFDDGYSRVASQTDRTVTAHDPADGLAETDLVFPVILRNPNTGVITGSITPPKAGVTINLYNGSTHLGTTTTAGAPDLGKFTFTGLASATYSLEAVDGAKKVTGILTVVNNTTAETVLNFPSTAITGAGIANTVLEQLGGTPPMAAAMSENLFKGSAVDNTKGVTAADESILRAGGTVVLTLTATQCAEDDAQDDRAKILAAMAANSQMGMLLDLSLTKSVTAKGANMPTTITQLSEVPIPLTISMEIPEMYQGKTNGLSLLHVHDGNVRNMATVGGGEGVTFTNIGGRDYMLLTSRMYSSYALVYKAPSTGGGDDDDNNHSTTPSPTPTPTATPKPTKKPLIKPTATIAPAATATPTATPNANTANGGGANDANGANGGANGANSGENANANANGADSKSKSCKLCGHCTPFLGICLWLWLIIVILVVAAVAVFIIVRKRKNGDGEN